MPHHKKYCKKKCSCEKKEHKEHKKCHCEQSKYKKCSCSCDCKCELNYYFPLPNLPSQPVGDKKISTGDWFAHGSVQACCSICPTVRPVYANPCDPCRYNQGTHPINNTAYF